MHNAVHWVDHYLCVKTSARICEFTPACGRKYSSNMKVSNNKSPTDNHSAYVLLDLIKKSLHAKVQTILCTGIL